MPNHSAARLDDTGSHDGAHTGAIVSSAKRTYLNHALPARVGDFYFCPKHGLNAIRTGSAKVWVESRRLARVGSKTWCGATIDSGAHNVTDGSAELDPFADPAVDAGEFDLTCIPRIMMAMQWPMAAKLMRKWFEGKANDDFEKSAPDTTSVTLDWNEGFERGRVAIAEISDPAKWFNQAAQALLCQRLHEAGLLRDKPTRFGDFAMPLRDLHKQHIQTVPVGEGGWIGSPRDRAIFRGRQMPDDLDAALHNFALHAVTRGQVDPEGDGWRVTVEAVGIYMRDTYDVENRDFLDLIDVSGIDLSEFGLEDLNDQWLGRWDCNLETWVQDREAGHNVRNSTFQGYRARTGQGGDYEIYSPVRELVLTETYSMICD